MLHVLVALLLLLATPFVTLAQDQTSRVTGTIASVTQTIPFLTFKTGGGTISAIGTWAGTLRLQCRVGTADTLVTVALAPVGGGAVVTSFTANGMWSFFGGFGSCVVNASAWSSGTATVSALSTNARLAVPAGGAALLSNPVTSAQGGTGGDFSASTGVLYDAAGTFSVIVCTSGLLVGGAPPNCTTTPALGTPASGVMTNVTGVPAAAILAGSFGAGAYVISTSLQAATIELGHATDTTLSRVSAGLIAVEGITVVDVSTAQTLSNKSLVALTGLGVRSTGTGAFDLRIANAENLTVSDKTLTIQVGDTSRTLVLGASPSVSGSNTGDQTITLTGGVTGSGTGSFVTTVITNANLTGGVTSVGNAATVVTNANLTGGVTSIGNAATVVTNANLTGGVTSVGNAATVVTNANLTGPITSTGNATAIASQTGTGTTFVMSAAPTITGGLHTALTTLGIRDTSAAFDVTLAAVSSTTLTADRTLTLDVGNVAHTLLFGTTAGTLTFPVGTKTIPATADNLSVFAATSSAQLLGVMSDETGTGALVFAASPTFTGTPVLATPTATDLKITGIPGGTFTSTLQLEETGGLAIFVAHGPNATTRGSMQFTIIESDGGNQLDPLKIGTAGTITMANLTAASGTPNSVCINSATKEITENAALTCTVSSARFKDNIRDQGPALPFVLALHPVRYTMKGYTEELLGLTAEEVAVLDPRLVSYDDQGRPHAVRYEHMVSVLAKALQETTARLEALEARQHPGFAEFTVTR